MATEMISGLDELKVALQKERDKAPAVTSDERVASYYEGLQQGVETALKLLERVQPPVPAPKAAPVVTLRERLTALGHVQVTWGYEALLDQPAGPPRLVSDEKGLLLGYCGMSEILLGFAVGLKGEERAVYVVRDDEEGHGWERLRGEALAAGRPPPVRPKPAARLRLAVQG